jgi:hypothetical protein
MKQERIKVTLYNKTKKEIDLSDFTSISEELFSNRTDIVKVVLPEGVEIVGDSAFENCTNLEEVIFPSTLKSIGKDAFVNCYNLKKAEYGKDVHIDATSFKGCSQLEA